MRRNQSTIQITKYDQYMITIPKALAKAKGYEKGDILEWEIDKHGDLVLRKV